MRARQHRPQLQPVEVRGDLLDLRGDLRHVGLAVFLGRQLAEDRHVLDPLGELGDRRQDAAKALELADEFLGGLLVVPEARHAHAAFELSHLFLSGRVVKESPG